MSVHARLTVSADTGISRTVAVRVVSREPSAGMRLVELEQPLAVGEFLYVRDADLAWLSRDELTTALKAARIVIHERCCEPEGCCHGCLVATSALRNCGALE